MMSEPLRTEAGPAGAGDSEERSGEAQQEGH